MKGHESVISIMERALFAISPDPRKMTRAEWKIYHRARRMVMRELNHVLEQQIFDVMCFGQSAVLYNTPFAPRNIPPHQIFLDPGV